MPVASAAAKSTSQLNPGSTGGWPLEVAPVVDVEPEAGAEVAPVVGAAAPGSGPSDSRSGITAPLHAFAIGTPRT